MKSWVLIVFLFYGHEYKPAVVEYPSKAACKEAQVEADRQPRAVATMIAVCLPGPGDITAHGKGGK